MIINSLCKEAIRCNNQLKQWDITKQNTTDNFTNTNKSLLYCDTISQNSTESSFNSSCDNSYNQCINNQKQIASYFCKDKTVLYFIFNKHTNNMSVQYYLMITIPQYNDYPPNTSFLKKDFGCSEDKTVRVFEFINTEQLVDLIKKANIQNIQIRKSSCQLLEQIKDIKTPFNKQQNIDIEINYYQSYLLVSKNIPLDYLSSQLDELYDDWLLCI